MCFTTVARIAAGGKEAVEIASCLCPQLARMDVRLDGPMDGIESAERIRLEQDVPGIYLTAYADPAVVAWDKPEGSFGLILKPFDERDLATQIELALYNHQTHRILKGIDLFERYQSFYGHKILLDSMKNIRPEHQLTLSFRFICKLHWFLLAFVFFFLLYPLAYGNELKGEKRVLILFPSQSDLPAYPMVEKGIKSSLRAGTEFHIEYFFEYMDLDRNPDQTHYQLLLELYRQKFSNKKIDLVIAYATPSLNLAITHGNELFPQTPVVFSGIPRAQLKGLNLGPMVTGVLADIDYAGLLETALKIHPQTLHVAIVNGASKTDLMLEKEFREALEPYAKRLDFIYLTRLPFGKIIEKVQNLPQHSVVLFYLLTQDGEGKGFPPWEAASMVADAANAPVYGCLDSYFGHGIVGGRLTSIEMTGVKAGEMALRILRGEKPSEIPLTSQGTIIDMFDWRQLKRFGIHEDRLPPGSIIRFKTYSFWELYRGYIVAALFLILVQSGLISFLLRQRAQRRRAQAQLAERLRFEEMLSALSARFVNLPPDQVDAEIKRVLESIGKGLNVDRVSVFEISEESQNLHLVHSHKDAEVAAPPSEFKFEQLPWVRQKLFKGEILTFSDPEELPAEAEADRNFMRAQGIISLAVIPLSTGEKTLGLLSLVMLRNRKEWPHEIIRQCRMVAEVFANALVRKRHEESLMQAEAKYRTVADFTYDWEYWANVDDSLEYVSPSCERISGYTVRDFMDNPPLFKEMIVPEDRDVWDRHHHDSRQEIKPREIQFRIQRPDKQVRWIEHNCQPVTDHEGRLQGFRCSNRDITSRKLAEVDLHRAYKEIEQLKDQLEAETDYLQAEIKLEHNFESIVGNSPALKYVLYKVEQVANADTTVLVLGETGTGKELIARAIHSNSPRRGRPLVKVNCATLPSHLIESELFGHERGAFTGAQSRQLGRFEVADGTSIFMDEIGELPPELQTKLLRVLQDGEFERLGSSLTIKVDVRVIAATNRDLEEEVRKGRFREDLFYRLNVFPITVPPLRQRAEDIPMLARFFVEKASKRQGKSIEKIPESVVQKLKEYSWPGNVRELENVIERAVINSSGPKLCLADDLAVPALDQMPPLLRSLQEAEKDHILQALQSTNWRIDGAKGAALILDVNPSTLRSRMRKLGIQKP
jgi:formate hydrogenlyase transcriptional activator